MQRTIYNMSLGLDRRRQSKRENTNEAEVELAHESIEDSDSATLAVGVIAVSEAVRLETDPPVAI